MFCDRSDLRTESDVEQKLLWALLTTPYPSGLAYLPAEVHTKANIRRLTIGKGSSQKLYFPDYVVVLSGLPVCVVEAKAPGEPLAPALGEARLYAMELNALFPAGLNPCNRVLACNGEDLLASSWDSAEPEYQLKLEALDVSDSRFAAFIETACRKALQAHADSLRARFAEKPLVKPTHLLGGMSVRNEQVGQNSFGASLVGEYGHLFNPSNRRDRAHVVKNAYVPSKRRERYVEPIDRLIRAAAPPTLEHVPIVEDTASPREITSRLAEGGRALENQILLLIGSVGSGKSTFVDYLSEVALPEEVRARSAWIRVDLNRAPLELAHAYDWVADRVSAELRDTRPDLDFDALETLQKVYGPELARLKKGPLALLPADAIEYKTRLSDELGRLQHDKLATAQALIRYICGNTNRLLVLALDNCDKRTRDEQLTMFQIAQWVQSQFRCLVILPLRDVTYDLHGREPPLDTALKDLVFRIEPPRFAEVLQRRVLLALKELQGDGPAKALSFTLPNGMRVEYPTSDLGMYLTCILNSLFAYDRYVRRMIAGVAGRDVRKALEIFLDFCRSGHIDEGEIYKIRQLEGRYTLPFGIVARVLLRVNRRFYDGDQSHLKNLFQCDPEDPLPNHFVRLSILRWLDFRVREKGPIGVRGYHRFGELLKQLIPFGYDPRRLRTEALYLLKEKCITAEHQRVDHLADEDLIRLSPSGSVHLTLVTNADFVAACAEDTWCSEHAVAERIARRIGSGGPKQHFSWPTIRGNAQAFLEYLQRRAAATAIHPKSYLTDEAVAAVDPTRDLGTAIASLDHDAYRHIVPGKVFVGGIPYGSTRPEFVALLSSRGLTPRDTSLPIDTATGRARGFSILTFATHEEASHAVSGLDGLEWKGRRLAADYSYEETSSEVARPTRHRDPPIFTGSDTVRIFVANVAYSVDDAQLSKFFSDAGYMVVDAFLVKDTASRVSKGYGFVTLGGGVALERVITDMNARSLNGRDIRVAGADPKKP